MSKNIKPLLFTFIALIGTIFIMRYIIFPPKWFPVWVDDFSGFSNDIFSKIIINGRFEHPDQRLGRDTGTSMLDSVKIKMISDSIFIGKPKNLVVNTFERYGCGCTLSVTNNNEKILLCKFRRQWKLKNIGNPLDTDPSFTPSIIVIYSFTINKNNIIKDINIKIVNVTPDMRFQDSPPTIK